MSTQWGFSIRKSGLGLRATSVELPVLLTFVIRPGTTLVRRVFHLCNTPVLGRFTRMEFIHIQCTSGHRLKAGLHLCGRVLPCPKCQDPVVIPQPPNSLSDTGVMRILGDVAPLPAAQIMSKQPSDQPRSCPRCEREMGRDRSVCPHCSCFVGTANEASRGQRNNRPHI